MVRKVKYLFMLRVDIRTQSGYTFSNSLRRVSRIDYEQARLDLEDLELFEYMSGP